MMNKLMLILIFLPFFFFFFFFVNVEQGAQEVFKELPHEFVSPDSLEDVVKNGGGCGLIVV